MMRCFDYQITIIKSCGKPSIMKWVHPKASTYKADIMWGDSNSCLISSADSSRFRILNTFNRGILQTVELANSVADYTANPVGIGLKTISFGFNTQIRLTNGYYLTTEMAAQCPVTQIVGLFQPANSRRFRILNVFIQDSLLIVELADSTANPAKIIQCVLALRRYPLA